MSNRKTLINSKPTPKTGERNKHSFIVSINSYLNAAREENLLDQEYPTKFVGYYASTRI